MVTLSYDIINKLVTVDSPATQLDLQEFVDLVRVRELDFDMMAAVPNGIIDAVGKATVPGGTTGITVTMLDDWQIEFEARPGPTTISCEIIGGVLVSDTATFPIAASAFTFVTRSIDVTQP